METFKFRVKELKEILNNVPDDAIVSYQRIEDSYFDTPDNGWETREVAWEKDWPTNVIDAFAAYYDKSTNTFVIHAHY